jgi:hypothetical protein
VIAHSDFVRRVCQGFRLPGKLEVDPKRLRAQKWFADHSNQSLACAQQESIAYPKLPCRVNWQRFTLGAYIPVEQRTVHYLVQRPTCIEGCNAKLVTFVVLFSD